MKSIAGIRLSGRVASLALFVAVVALLERANAAEEPADVRAAANAVGGLEVHPALEATLFAAEPMLLSPTNIDVDHRGRVWVCEVVNYRRRNGERPEGDRILILEDTDGDGRADSQKVFYQGRDVDTAMGICVLGNKVIVSVAPNVFVFTDEDGDDKADRKDVLFSNTGQPQHDHSNHAFIFGPDGKLYWNFGNTGKHVHDKDGNPVVDLRGRKVIDDGHPYFGGMAFRCNLDGSEFETLAHNFRNNYELAVDSFGTVWQSDNDDDGNRGVRINYVMEGGNFGYRDEMTGAGWRTPRTNLEKEVPLQHWHLNDPGVVPNVLQTGGGSPTGICVYEGTLLPKEFWGQLIHCDAGPNVVRAYVTEKVGAGYRATMIDILNGKNDNWFRPSDVCVAPDGSLIVADWYDPGVGGHAMGDVDKGRIFRVAPPKTPYKIPKVDVTTVEGAIEALQSPNQATRYLGWTALHEMGDTAVAALKSLSTSGNPRDRARALWLLAQIPDQQEQSIADAVADSDPDIRVLGLRLARRPGGDLLRQIAHLVADPAPEVRRECSLALAGNDSEEAARLWATLAAQYDGKDRWQLEALGISAEGNWDQRLQAWRERVGDKWTDKPGRDIMWRSRAASTPELLAKLIASGAVPNAELPRMLRAFDFEAEGDAKNNALNRLAFRTDFDDRVQRDFVASEAALRMRPFDIASRPKDAQTLEKTLDGVKGSLKFVQLVDRFQVTTRYADLLKLLQEVPEDEQGIAAMQLLLARGQDELVSAALGGDDVSRATATARALGLTGGDRASAVLTSTIGDANVPLEVRRQAVRSLAMIKNGAQELLAQAEQGTLDAELKDAAAAALHSAQWNEIKAKAAEFFPLPATRNNASLPPVAELVEKHGDAGRGKAIFATTGTCAKCHIVRNEGKEVGPNLSEIGSKLSRQAMFESVLFPSAGISHNYETYVIALTDGNTLNGVLTGQTPDAVSIKGSDAVERTIKRADIDEIAKQDVSPMPADLQKLMTAEELVDVVEYLATLKKP